MNATHPGLPDRIRRIAAVNALDTAAGFDLPALDERALAQVVEALDAAEAAIPWIGVDHIRDRLEKALQ